MNQHSLVWFRNDLRIADNPALRRAFQNSDQVSAVFFVTPSQWQSHHLSARRIEFTSRALQSLQTDLAQLGVKLHVITVDHFADVPERLIDLCREQNVRQLCFNREYALDESRRDQQVHEHCKREGIEVFTAHGSVVIPPGAVCNHQNAMYRVFTPFKRAWLQTLAQYDRAPYPAPKAIGKPLPAIALAEIPRDNAVDLSRFPAGEAEAHRRLKRFTEEDLADYHRDRDIPAIEGTSMLSPYLSMGLLSPRACLHALRMANEGELSSGNEGAQTWLSELIWREFYIHILAAFPHVSRHKPFKPKTDLVPWRHNEAEFKRWCEGNTGFPLVDAAMRQLNTTGWMHNRLRMVTATFLTKYLLIDWRWGEQYFMEQLVDGHLAANNGGWQWSASTGTDAAPYFRILSPVRQGERFDHKAEFIKTYVEELRECPAKIIHKPGHADLLEAGYPAPMVDLKAGKERCLSAFQFALAE